jgi:hypothetical protein
MSGDMPLLSAGLVEALLPEDAAFMGRTDLRQTRMLGYSALNADSVTASLMGILGNRPAVRHRAGVTEAILRIFERAGLPVGEDLRVFETMEEAERHADRLVEEGFRLFSPYPLREGRFPDAAQLAPPDLWRRLNAKENLVELVSAENLPPREIIAADRLAARPFGGAVYLKAGGDLATGWGYAVRYCDDATSYAAALDWFAARSEDIPSIIIEADMRTSACWCVSISVGEAGARYLGAAEQIFGAPGKQAGSVVDPENPFPPAGIRLAVEAGNKAAEMGFRGIAGLDIGAAADGRMIAFDPNFRFNSSTQQAFLHEPAARRSGLSCSLSFNRPVPLPFAEVALLIAGPVAEGWFVPTRLFDGALCPAAEGKSICTGFVLGNDRQDAEARQRQLAVLLGLG